MPFEFESILSMIFPDAGLGEMTKEKKPGSPFVYCIFGENISTSF